MKTLYFLIGFITNSILMRISGKIPDDDLIYPVFIFIILVVWSAVEVKWKNNG